MKLDERGRSAFYGYHHLSAVQKGRLWSRRFAAGGQEELIEACKAGAVTGLEIKKVAAVDDDAAYQMARFKWKTFGTGKGGYDKLPPFHTLYTDEVSGFRVKTIGGACSAFVSVCARNNYIIVDLVAQRSDYKHALAQDVKVVSNLGAMLGKEFRIRRIRSDSAREIQRGDALILMQYYGIEPEPVAATTHAPGGKHESAIQRVTHRARAMFVLAPWMPRSTWGLAMLYAAHVLNVMTSLLHGEKKSAYERVTERKPNANQMPTLIRTWGCRVSYGLTKAQRAHEPRGKLADLTTQCNFVGVKGNQVLLYHLDDNTVKGGTLQRCEFHEGIYTERTPPTQSNPMTLLKQDYDNYVETLKAQGIIEDKDGAEYPATEYAKLVLPSEIQRRAADAWSDVTIGGKKFFNDGVSADSLATNHDFTPEPMVVTTTAAVESTSNATIPEDTAAEQSQPIAERLRNEREVSTAPKGTENTMPQITVSPQQRQEKVQEWREVILYDDDHRPFIITDAKMRKTKSATPEWWIYFTPEGGGDGGSWRCERVVKQSIGKGGDNASDKGGDDAEGEQQLTTDPKHSAVGQENVTSDREQDGADEDEGATDDDSNTRERRGRARTAESSNKRRSRRHHAPIAKRTRSRATAMHAMASSYARAWVLLAKVGHQGVQPERSWKDPKSTYECLESPDYKGWVEAMRSEMLSWKDLGVYKVINRRKRRRGVSTHPLQEVYTRKWLKANNGFDKHKCRLVAMGNLFKPGIDYKPEVFSPTVAIAAARVFLFLALQENKKIIKFDVATAFLLADTSATWYAFYPQLFRIAEKTDEEIEEIRKSILEGTDEERAAIKRELRSKVDPSDERVLEIIKTVYGDPAGNRQFFIHFRAMLADIGFAPLRSQPCIYQRLEPDNTTTRILTHCDDGLVAIADQNCERLIGEIQEKAKIRVDREPDEFLGVHLKYDREVGRLELLMDQTISDAAEEFKDELEGVYKTKAPAKNGTVLDEATDEEHEAAKHLRYQKLIGILTWITQVKVETCTIVSMLGQKMAKWNELHHRTGLGVLAWLRDHRHEGIVFHRTTDFDPHNCLFAYADADLAGDTETRKSRSGKLIMIGSKSKATVVSCRSALQKLIALSTTASEIISLMDTVTDVTSLRVLLSELGYPQTKPTITYEDNQPAIALVRDQTRMEGATKHTDMRHLKLRELMEDGQFDLTYCRTNVMMADIFTKCLPAPIFKPMADFVTGRRGDYTAENMIKGGRALIIMLADK